jgi:small neutral amino acid transporter SnatA (MarC family)
MKAPPKESVMKHRFRRHLLQGLAGQLIWWFVYHRLAVLADWFTYALLPLARRSHLGAAGEFFVFKSPKVLLLPTLIVFTWGIFSTSLPAIRPMGEILVFMFGYHMLSGRSSPIQKLRSVASTDPASVDVEMPVNNTIDETEVGIAVSPIAAPILAVPGTIATAMSFLAGGKPSDILITLASFRMLWVITYFLFIKGQRIVRFIGDEALRVVTRMMGLRLAVMGIQMVIHGIHSAAEMTF